MSINLIDELIKINNEFIKHNFSIMSYDREIQLIQDKKVLVNQICNKKREELINELNNRSVIASEEDKPLYYSLIKHLNQMTFY